MIKNLLCVFFAICTLAACQKGDGPDNSPIKLDDKSQSDQTLYTDTYQKVVSFTAVSSWNAQVAAVNKSGDLDWISISPTSGGAGKVDMKIIVSPNPSGDERRAQIDIVCDGTTISISVVQKGGNDPNTDREIVMTDADPEFKAFLIKKYDANSDGKLTAAELNSATTLDCSKQNLKSIKGIEYISGLSILNCENNQLQEIDLSNNHYLEQLFCGNNPIKSITTSANQGASTGTGRWIDAIGISSESLTVNGPCIDEIGITGESLKSLDVRQCLRLKQLSFEATAISSIDLSQNKELEYLTCDHNKLTTLDISENGRLNSLECSENQLTSLDIFDHKLEVLSCSSNNIKELKVGSGLKQLHCDNNPLELIDLDHSNLPVESTPIIFNSTAAKLKIIFGRMERAHILGMTSELDVTECGSLEWLRIVTLKEAGPKMTIAGQDFLKLVDIVDCYKTLVDVSQAKSVENFYVEKHLGKSLKIIGGEALTDITVKDEDFETIAMLETLDLSQCASLIDLDCMYNGKLKSVNINGCTALETAYLGGNNLDALDVSTNTKLWKLTCEGNNLSSLDLSKNTALVFINCSANKLTELDISNCSFGPQYPHNTLKCNDMPTLNTLYLKTGWNVENINAAIDSHTQIKYK